jgi:hypothetical protein
VGHIIRTSINTTQSGLVTHTQIYLVRTGRRYCHLPVAHPPCPKLHTVYVAMHYQTMLTELAFFYKSGMPSRRDFLMPLSRPTVRASRLVGSSDTRIYMRTRVTSRRQSTHRQRQKQRWSTPLPKTTKPPWPHPHSTPPFRLDTVQHRLVLGEHPGWSVACCINTSPSQCRAARTTPCTSGDTPRVAHCPHL